MPAFASNTTTLSGTHLQWMVYPIWEWAWRNALAAADEKPDEKPADEKPDEKPNEKPDEKRLCSRSLKGRVSLQFISRDTVCFSMRRKGRGNERMYRVMSS